MYPQEAVARRRRRKNSVCLADATVDTFKMLQEARDGTWDNGDMATYLDITRSQLTGNDAKALMRVTPSDPQHAVGPQLATPPMNFTHTIRCGGTTTKIACVQPLLHRDVRFGFKL